MTAIPVMIVPVLTRADLLYRMVSSIDYPVDLLLIIDNGDCVNPVTLAERYRHNKHRILKFPSNLGVATSWNIGIKSTPFAPWWLISGFDNVWPQGSLGAMAGRAQRDNLVLSGGAPPWTAFTIGDRVIERVGLADEFIHPAYGEDNDWERRILAAGFHVARTTIAVHHENSSTLHAGFQQRNTETFVRNMDYYHQKVARGDMGEGHWSLTRRRAQSWD